MEWLLGITGAGSLAVTAWLIYKLVRSKDDQLVLMMTLDKEREEKRNLENDLNAETAAHAVTEDLRKKERDLRASAESQRNDAWKEARAHAVEVINASGIADAVSLGNRILSAPLPGTRLSETPDGALEKP